MSDVPQLNKGQPYILSFTRPIYDKVNKKYIADRYRFLNPKIYHTYYGGKCSAPRHCAVCGRTSPNTYVFVREDMVELYVSSHCLTHPATRIWGPETSEVEVEKWYQVQNSQHDDVARALVGGSY